MSLGRIFSVFSRRPEAAEKPRHDVPETTRNRVLLWWSQHFNNPYLAANLSQSFWSEIRNVLQMRIGTLRLSQGGRNSATEDTVLFLLKGDGERFLDFLEDLFHTEFYRGLNLNWDKTVEELNELLRVDDLPYHLTKFVTETADVQHRGKTVTSFRIVAHPKVVMRESEIMHANASAPALELLRNPAFVNANKEYLAALEDYRKGDYPDCLTKCNSSFESFMKVLCHVKRWPYSDKDVAGTLIKTIIVSAGLEGYFEQLLIIVATLRNRHSSSHGAGTAAKVVSPHLAQYALNVTASAMLLLAGQAKL